MTNCDLFSTKLMALTALCHFNFIMRRPVFFVYSLFHSRRYLRMKLTKILIAGTILMDTVNSSGLDLEKSDSDRLMEWFWSDESDLMDPNRATEYYRNIVHLIDQFRATGGQIVFSEEFESELRRRAVSEEPSLETAIYIAKSLVAEGIKIFQKARTSAALLSERGKIMKKVQDLGAVPVDRIEEVVSEIETDLNEAFAERLKELRT
jgi:hypothetical protein